MNPFGSMRCHCLLAAALTALALSAHADERDVRPGEIDPAAVIQPVPGMPARGTTMARVRANLGNPGREVGPVGEPPISRWVYAEFTVYFEHDRVLHSVKHRER